MRRLPILLILLVFVFAGVRSAAAQTDRATLEGTVTDPSGATVAGAKVQIVAVETGLSQERSTNSNGVYRFPAIAIGFYTVTVSHDGFNAAEFKDVEVRVGETRTLDVALDVAGVKTDIEVRSNPAPLERTSAESSTVIQRDQIGNLPVNGRNWATLLILAPWAQDDGGGDQRTIRFAGRGRDDNNFTFDGVEATGIQEQAQKSQVRLQVSPDAIAEYSVQSALYTAEYGAGAGGQVDVVTKSGTNDFHGSVFGYLRNSAFDARSFIDPSTVPPFRLGQYGLSFGGPIKKDRTFFFLNYEGLRQFQGRTLIANVPDPSLQQEVLLTGGPDENGNQVGPSPQLCPILQAYPWRASTGKIGNCSPVVVFPDSSFTDIGAGTGPTASNIDLFTHQGSTTIHEDTWLARLDHNFTDKTTLYVRAQRDISFSYAPLGNALDRQGITNHPANYLIALQHIFSPSISNVAKFGINRSPFHNPQYSVFPLAVNTTNFESLNNSNTDNEVGTTLSYLDNLTITHGRHTFKTGIEVKRVRLNQGITADSAITFASTASSNPAFASDNSFIYGDMLDNLSVRNSWCCRGLRHTLVMPYFQDEWKLRPSLTVNLGLRWEYYAPITEVRNRTTIFDLTRCAAGNDPGKPDNLPGLCPPGSPIFFPNYRNWDPRIGIAWAPSALHSKTVIRTGFGIYHGAGQNDDLNAALESNTTRLRLSQADLPPGTTLSYPIDPFLPLATQFQAPRALQRDRRDLYVEQWGLTIEQVLPANFSFSSSYLGTHGVRLFARTNENVCITNFPSCVRPLPNFDIVDLKRNDGTSSYSGLLLSLQRRMSAGWEFQTNYTYSHSINDGSVGGGEANAPENVACRSCDRGPSVFDTRHNLVVNSVYQLPIGPGQRYWHASGFAGKLLEGWSMSGVAGWHTGHPLTIIFSPSSTQIPDGNDSSDQRPDIVPGVSVVPVGQNSNSWINVNAFQAPPTDPVTGLLLHFGDAGRGLIRSPSIWQIDFAISKETKLTERLAMQFRVEAFNIFNHTQLGDPSSLDIASGTFGLIDSTVNFNNNNDNFAPDNVGTGTPRQLEFVLRFNF